MKILLFHDTFLMKWGAERMNIEIAKILGCDIATAIWKSDCYDARSMGFQWRVFEVFSEFQKWMLGFLRMKWRFFRSWKLLREYDAVFFSNEAISGIWSIKPGTKTYYYAHSISRHLFDLYDQYLAKVPWYAKVPYRIMAYLLKRLYIAEVKRIDIIFVNSTKNKERIKDWFGRDDAIVLYPPVDTDTFYFVNDTWWKTDKNKQEIFHLPFTSNNYFLSFSRLTHAKRVNLIIEAFRDLPEKNLLILYGEHDSQKEEFMRLGAWCPNISFLHLSDNRLLPAVIRWAIATIAISREEDFGMVVIESMACGVPVIAVDEGGYRETILDGKTGRLIANELCIWGDSSLISGLKDIVKNAHPEEWSFMKDDCVNRAQVFSLEKCRQQLELYF